MDTDDDPSTHADSESCLTVATLATEYVCLVSGHATTSDNTPLRQWLFGERSAGSSASIPHQQRCGRAAVVGSSRFGIACCNRHQGCSTARRSLTSGTVKLHKSVIVFADHTVPVEQFERGKGVVLPSRASSTSVDPTPLDYAVFSHTVMNDEKMPDRKRRPVFTS